jgi:rfaE bifunctional protein kinase chain/domain
MAGLPDWSGHKVLVVGDIILDRFIHGTVSRISPEAPIPVVDVAEERLLPGGAANVAHNIRALGGESFLIGAVGDDQNGDTFRQVLDGMGLSVAGLVEVPDRVTTVKSRIIAHHQQVVRVDREVRTPLPQPYQRLLLSQLEEELPSARALVVSDYAKGVFDPPLLQKVGKMARRAGVPLVVDPKPCHFPYPGATVVTPNREEAAGFLGRSFSTAEIPEVAQQLLGATDWEAVLFTLGSEGMALAQRDRPVERIPARVREVFDVTGAGDTVVAVLALALGAGVPLSEAAHVANAAAGVVVGKVGTAVCTPEDLKAALLDENR